MKKLFLTVLALAGVVCSVKAQDKGAFELGGNLGIGLSQVHINNSSTTLATSTKTGVNVGFVGEYYFSDRWGIKAKLVYDQKGWSGAFLSMVPGEYREGDINLNYLTIPVMADWHFGRRRNWNLNFGLYSGFLMSAKAEPGEDIKELFNTTDFGMALGIGYKFFLNDKTRLYVEYEEQYGFSDLFKDTSGGYNMANNRSSINVGILFLLDK